ncbi:hypothetical protein Gasu2_66520 [Galdieria sulphuraria]|nr:hypothetical protein Gasu2_66520 [Galdieria sulphuraria]
MIGAAEERITSEDEWSLSISQRLLSTGFFPANCNVSDNDTNCKTLRDWLETNDSKVVLKELANWIASEWNLEKEIFKGGKKENTVEGLLMFYRYLNIRIPVSILTGKSFQWTLYKPILEEVVGIMLTIRQLREEPWLTENEEVLFSNVLEDGNIPLNTKKVSDDVESDSVELTSFQVQNEMRKVIGILEKYSNSSRGNWMNFEQVKCNLNEQVERGQREHELLDADVLNQFQLDDTAVWDLFSRLEQIMEDFQENQRQLELLDEWKQSIPRLDPDFGKKIQRMVALLKPAFDILQENQKWNVVCSELSRDGRKLEKMESQLKLCESLLVRLENFNKNAEYAFKGENKENIVEME